MMPKLNPPKEVVASRGKAIYETQIRAQVDPEYMGKVVAIDTPTVTRAVEAAMPSLQRTLPEDVQVKRAFRQSNFIDTAIGNVQQSLLEGILIVSVVMLLFLMNWRIAVITLSAIPLSLLVDVLMMRGFGFGINTMT